MQLTIENFMKHFETMEIFYIVNQINIEHCSPLIRKHSDENSIYYERNGKVESQNIKHFHILKYPLNSGNVFTTWEEAKRKLRFNFIDYIDYMNKSYWKTNPVIVQGVFRDME